MGAWPGVVALQKEATGSLESKKVRRKGTCEAFSSDGLTFSAAPGQGEGLEVDEVLALKPPCSRGCFRSLLVSM